MLDQIQQLAEELHADVIGYRRHLHQHPELSFHEEKTANYVAEVLAEEGIDFSTGVGGFGLIAMIEGRQEGEKTVALRGDMDALPIEEENDVPYRSTSPGVMHACGHDVHTSSLLGTTRILHRLRDQIAGRIKVLFQPAEERLPGGASLMIKDGALTDPTPASIFGQHVHPPLAVGKVGVKGGMYMASADELFLTVEGRGGHAALPHEAVDPIVLAANIVMALQQLVSRRANPTIPTVLTFGKINSQGGATNIIPALVKLEGTFRTMDEHWRSHAHKEMVRLAEGIAKAHGGNADLVVKKGYPYLLNHEGLARRFKEYAIEYLGEENVVDLPIRMTAEDFSYFSQAMPACFYRLGTGNPSKGITSPIHTPTFDVDEDCLRISTGLMAYCALRELAATE